MNLDEIIKGRRSIRKFKRKKISRKLINNIIEAGEYAPSACNAQMWHFVVVDDDKIKSKLCYEAHCTHLIKESAFTVFVLYDKTTTPQHYANVQSASAAIQNMLLKSYSLGIGSVWLCAYGDEEKVKKILKIPENFLIIANVCFGYDDESPIRPLRREDVISYNIFRGVLSYPKTFDPKDWTIDEIKNFQSFKIRAKSAFSPEHKPVFKGEFKKIIDEIEPLKGRILDLFPYTSNYSYGLLLKEKIKYLYVYEMSEEVINFIKTKLGPTKKKINFIEGTYPFPIENEFFDVVLCFNVLEKISDQEKVIKEAYRVLKKDGNLYLLFTNKNSFFGLIDAVYLYFKNITFLYSFVKKFFYKIYIRSDLFKEVSISVPFRPISYNKVNKMLRRFRIEKCIGIGFFPKSKLRESIFTNFLKKYCQSIFIKAVKK